MGKVKRTRETAALMISTFPTTVTEYGKCVDAEWCSPPAMKNGPCAPPGEGGAYGPTFDNGRDEASRLPVTCVTHVQAADFCRYVGGRLPNSAEWLAGVRGPEPRRFAWGNDRPSCVRLPRLSFSSSMGNACCGHSCASMAWGTLGVHPEGQSPAGVQDVLITKAEIVAADADSSGDVCNSNTSACFATGLQPGAIDTFVAMPAEPDEHPEAVVAAGFRCVWEGGA